MTATLGVAWIAFAIVATVISLFSVAFVKYYQSRHDSALSATITSILSIIIVLATAAILPVDIFLVSSTVDSTTGLKKLWADEKTIYWMTFTVQVVYFVFYGLILTFSFLVVPFAYFYYDNHQEDGHTKKQRRASALKYSMVFIVAVALLFLFGLFVKPNVLPPHIDLDWFRNLLTESYGEKALWFTIGCLFVPGMAVYILYTAPGLSMIPFLIIKSRRKIDVERDEIEDRLAVVRERQRSITHKYSNSNEPATVADIRDLDNLNDEERILDRRLDSIEEATLSLLQKTLKVLRPFQVFIGLVLLAVVLLLMISMAISVVDKVTFSVCGRKCGYIISNPKIFNPLDFILVRIQKLFPLDYLVMVGLITYFFLATMTGIVNIGVRFLWLTLYRIKKASTTPQGLLFTSILLSLGLLATNYAIISVAVPGYAHYGSQVYCNHTEGGRRDCSDAVDKIFPCDIYAPIEICTPTVSSTLIDRITLNTPLFGLIFYYSQWIFILSFALGFFICLFRSPNNNTEEEEEGLLDNDRHHSTT